MLKFYVGHGMIGDQVLEIISFRQSNWLENFIDFHVKKKELKLVIFFTQNFISKCLILSMGRQWKMLGNRCKIEFIKKDDYDKIIKQQSKLTFNGNKPYENYDSYTFEQNEILMDKPIYLGFTVLELLKLHMFETFYDKLTTIFWRRKYSITLY